MDAAGEDPNLVLRHAVAQLQRGDIRAAEAAFRHLLARYPPNAFVLSMLGIVTLQSGRWAEAVQAFGQALALDPTSIEARANRGVALIKLERFEEALADCVQVVAQCPTSAHAHTGHGVALTHLGRIEEAVAAFDRALAQAPELADAWFNRGVAKRAGGDVAGGLADIEQTLALSPNHGDALWNQALFTLCLGDFARGWPLYERRLRIADNDAATGFCQPPWRGDFPIDGKTILLYGEQGAGDTIQFARYIPMVAELGANVVVHAPGAVLALLRSLRGEYVFVAEGEPIPPCDARCPLLSLPLAFTTTVDTIPASPYLSAETERRNRWKRILGEPHVPRVGLCWAGKADMPADRHRTIRLQELMPLFEHDCEFHALQTDIRPQDRAAADAQPRLRLHTDAFGDYADTAALIAEMDLVVTVDTSVAHVSGAMGAPTWLIVPQVPEWRWLLDRDDTPWYPNTRIFRPCLNEWGTVVGRVSAALGAWVKNRKI